MIATVLLLALAAPLPDRVVSGEAEILLYFDLDDPRRRLRGHVVFGDDPDPTILKVAAGCPVALDGREPSKATASEWDAHCRMGFRWPTRYRARVSVRSGEVVSVELKSP